jgi:hypothetical protein
MMKSSLVSKLNLDAQVILHIAPDGQYVAIANTLEQHGLVLDLATGQATMQLERDDYCLQLFHTPWIRYLYSALASLLLKKSKLLFIPATCGW